MKKLKKAKKRDAIIASSVACGVIFGSPLAVNAKEQNLSPELVTVHDFDPTNTYRQGQTHQKIRILQFELKKRNLYHQEIDGTYGANTLEAIKDFQTLYNLNPDGVAGPETLEKLNEVIQTPVKEDLQKGDVGPEVELIQRKLEKLKYYSGEIDGKFGPLTEESIREYQSKYNLEVTGIANENTIEHLMKNANVKGITLVSKKIQNITTTDSTSTVSVDTGIISIARQYLGTPYVWGGTSPSGFDCSGFLRYIYAQKGVSIPRTVSDIWNHGSSVSKLSVGDIVFFQTYKKGPSHAGIYLGDGKFIHSSSSNGVTISEMSLSYWQSRYLGAKRISN